MRSGNKQKSTIWLITAFIAGVFVLLIGVSFGQEVRRRAILQQHVQDLKRDIGDHEQKIAELDKLIEYLKTDSYIEKVAHQKLGYQKPGEHVVIVPDAGKVAGVQSGVQPVKEETTNTPLAWWNLFFGQQS